MSIQIVGLSGSLRAESLHTALLQNAQQLAPEGVEIRIHSLADIPLFNSDLGEEIESVQQLKSVIGAADGVLLASPEYNYSVSGVMKNALDWASRPTYNSVFAHKPVGLLGASPGSVGSARAQAHLRQIMAGMVAATFPHPEFLISGAFQKFDSNGHLTDEKTREFLTRYIEKFVEWIQKVGS